MTYIVELDGYFKLRSEHSMNKDRSQSCIFGMGFVITEQL